MQKVKAVDLPQLLHDLNIAKADRRYDKLLKSIARTIKRVKMKKISVSFVILIIICLFSTTGNVCAPALAQPSCPGGMNGGDSTSQVLELCIAIFSFIYMNIKNNFG